MNWLRKHTCWQRKRLYWEGVPGWRAGGQGNPGELLCQVALSLRFYGDGISFQVVLSQSFWLRVLPSGALFSQDGCQREGFWEVVGHVVSPFDLSWTLPVGGSLLVLCSLPGPPVVKQLLQMVTMVPGQGGRLQSLCLPYHCAHCWVFQICWHIECSTFTASSFRIWSSSAGIPSPPLALLVVMLPKAHLTSHCRMSGSRWVVTPSWLSGSLTSFLYSTVNSCHLFIISSASVKSIPFPYCAHLCIKCSLGISNFLDL